MVLLLVGINGLVKAQPIDDPMKKIRMAAVPLVNYSKTIGASFGAMANMYYKVSSNDTISPSSSTGIFGMYTTNKTYFLAAFQQLYLHEDRWRISAAVGAGNINSQYWQDFPVDGGEFIGYGTKARFAMAKVDRKVYDNLYVGANANFVNSETAYDFPDFFPDSLKYDSRYLNNLGYQVNYDKRDHQISPFSGFNIAFKSNYFRKWLKGENNFVKFEFIYNHYFMVRNERNILVARFSAAISAGDVPFQGKNVVGQDDLRGYSSGRYRNDQIYALQAEYRWRFYKRLGMVGFAGVATAVEKAGDIFNTGLLPGAGVGLRYLMIPEERINVGIDIAKGKGDWGLYFRIGESFGR